MADIYHWRRRIQPGLLRQPATTCEIDDTDPEHAHCSSFRKPSRPRPKLSAYFSHNLHPADQDKPISLHYSIHVPLNRLFPSSASNDDEEVPEESDFDTDQVMDSIMRKLMAEPYRPLDIKHNSSLRMIFESYRALHDHNAGLVERLSQEVEGRYADKIDMETENKRRGEEKEEYKAEIKRLELIIAKGKGGVASVMQARQGSTLRKARHERPVSTTSTAEDYRETLIEFLKRSRAEDKASGRPQRSLRCGRQVSPSQKMAALSHVLSITDHHHNTLPSESPPSPPEYTSLSQASHFENMLLRTSLSDTDSHETDPGHENQVSGVTLVDNPANAQHELPEYMHSILNSGFDGTNIVERPTNTDLKSSHRWRTTAQPSAQKPTIRRNLPYTNNTRRFSIELGDDIDSEQRQQHMASSPMIQRSASVSQVAPKPTHSRSHEGLAMSIQTSPICSPPLVSPSLATPSTEPHRLSKIPSPVFDASLARPRREDSTSSLFTVVRSHSRDDSRSSISIGSPRQHSSNSTRSGEDIMGGQRVTVRYGSVRGTNMAVTAARAVATKNVHGSITGIAYE